MDPAAVEKAIGDGTKIFMEEGIWQAYHRDHAEAIAERYRLNEPSYLIDGIFDYLHSSVGYEAFPEDHQLAEISGQGTVSGYLALAREIAELSRLERRALGERLLRCLNDAMERQLAFSALYLEKRKAGYLILSKSGDRTERQTRLNLLTAMIYCHLGLEKVIGIATEPMSGEGRSYDVLGYSGAVFKNAKELSNAAREFFGDPYAVNGNEYMEGDKRCLTTSMRRPSLSRVDMATRDAARFAILVV